jgi:hypothetical protein
MNSLDAAFYLAVLGGFLLGWGIRGLVDRFRNSTKSDDAYDVIARFSCVICSHEWTAVFPDGTEALECPKCGYFTPLNYDYE